MNKWMVIKNSANNISITQAKARPDNFLLMVFESGSHSAAQTSLKLTVIFLPEPSAGIRGVSPYIWLQCIF